MAQTETPGVSQQSELGRLGFTRGNPFATMEADQERAILDDLFVDIDNLERIRAAHTVIVHAPRGCGKSAARVRLANSLAPWTDRPDVDTFAIEFLQFDGILASQADGQEITALTYVDAILHQGAHAIFPFLFAPGPPNPRLERLSVAGQVRLGRLVWSFARDLLSPESAHERFSALLPGTPLPWSGFRKAMREHQVGDLLGEQARACSPQAAALVFLLDMDLEDRDWTPFDPVERLRLLVDLVQRMGFQRLAVMVDRVDEISLTTSNPLAQAALIEPLLAHLPLMEMPGVSFKFFIPTATRDALLTRASIRVDRLDIVEATVDWSESRLRKLLAKRLTYFSGLPDFSQNTSTRREDRPDGEESLGEAIERELILLAAHSPRRLIRAGQLLLNAYLARPNADLLIWADWLSAQAEMMRDDSSGEAETTDGCVQVGEDNQATEISSPGRQGEALRTVEEQTTPTVLSPQGLPILYISRRRPRMRLKEREILLSETEVKIIRALMKRNGTIDEEALVDEVWNKVISTAGIDVALKRIRDEIDKITGIRKTGLKYYLTKKSGTIMLMNYQQDDEI